MDTETYVLRQSDLLVGVVAAVIVGTALGLVISTLYGGEATIDEALSPFLTSIIAPVIIALLGAYISVVIGIQYERIKNRRQEQLQWKLKTVSLLQRIALELTRIDRSEELDRPERTAVYQYDEDGPLSHIDSLFIELMEQYTTAPPGIDEYWKIEISRLKHAYSDPGNHPEIDKSPNEVSMTVDYLKNWFKPELERVLHELGATTEGVSADQLPRYTAGKVAGDS